MPATDSISWIMDGVWSVNEDMGMSREVTYKGWRMKESSKAYLIVYYLLLNCYLYASENVTSRAKVILRVDERKSSWC